MKAHSATAARLDQAGIDERLDVTVAGTTDDWDLDDAASC